MPVIIMPGILLADNYWASFVAALPSLSNHPLLFLSLPAHSPSRAPQNFSKCDVTPHFMARAVDVAISELFVGKKVIVMGHSTGGFSAINYTAHYPEKVSGIISIAGFDDGHWKGGEGLLQRLADGNRLSRLLFRSIIRVMQRSKLIYYLLSVSLTRNINTYLRDRESKKAMFEAHTYFKTSNPYVLQEFMAGVLHLNITDSLKNITVPSLIMYGESDPVIPKSMSERLIIKIANSKKSEFNTGHMIFAEDRNKFCDEISKFLNSLS